MLKNQKTVVEELGGNINVMEYFYEFYEMLSLSLPLPKIKLDGS